nr:MULTISPECIES: YlbF family regulator [Anoxybacillus]
MLVLVATIERLQLLDVAEQLGKMIVESDVAEEYRRCFYHMQQDEKAQQLIHRFVQLKERYEDVQRFGKYHPDYKEVTKQVREAKRELDLYGPIAAFKRAEKEMQSLLDEISTMIGRAVSENIKVPTGNPYFDSLSCGGGCGSGGACGCRTK